MLQNLSAKWAQLQRYLPAIFFIGGFIWDALTVGKRVQTFDLWILSVYWLVAAGIIVLMSRPRFILADPQKLPQLVQRLLPSWLPYFALQFLFGSLLSALFILYFKSAGHVWSWLLAAILAGLLVLNEFLEDHYRKFTLLWAMFGLCTILLFNFVLPFVIGSISAWWFYLSTALGLSLAMLLRCYSPAELGSLKPVYVLTALLLMAYSLDALPPVPLVKRDIQMAYAIQKQNTSMGRSYLLTQQAAPWWQFWRNHSDDLQFSAGGTVYCFSSVFAPSGLRTRLVHVWQRHTKKGWITESTAGFALNGGRDNGYRGYTFKSNPQAGDWRVRVMSESGKTLAVHTFTVQIGAQAQIVQLAY